MVRLGASTTWILNINIGVIFNGRYIEFYLETMANSENISLIYYIAALLKTARFSNLHEPNEVRITVELVWLRDDGSMELETNVLCVNRTYMH